MAYAIGTDKKDGVVVPRSAAGTGAKASTVQKDIRTETKSSPIKTSSTGGKSTAPVTRAGSDTREAAPTETRFSYTPKSPTGVGAKDDNFGRSVTPNASKTTTRPGFTTAATATDTRTEQRATRPDGGLNSDKFYQRVEDNGGVVPFEGPVDWGGIYDYLQAPADRRLAAQQPVDITVHGGAPAALYDKVDPETGLSFGMMLDFLNSSGNMMGRPAADRLPRGVSVEGKQPAPYAPTHDSEVTRAYGDTVGPSAPLDAIDAATVPDIEYPSITQSADAGDLFSTDGLATAPDGTVLTPGRDAPPNVFVGADGETYRRDFTDDPYLPGGALYTRDGIASAAEPSTWDNVVDNTGKLLSHSGLGSIVSTLFPDLWSGGGDLMKSMFDGERGTATANGEFTRWDPREGVSMGGGSSFSRDAGGYVDTTPHPVGKGRPSDDGFVTVPPIVYLPGDTNGDGVVDDRDLVAQNFNLPPTRKVRFPDMPPYDPGRSDEWTYFTHNHLADGGVVDAYAEGGAIDPSDPKVKLIGDTEDVLEDIKNGKKPDEAAAATLKAFVAQFGDAALRSLNDNVGEGLSMKGAGKGRQIKGPGGPKDDAVPAVIVEEGTPVSPAKLSNNEFVMPVSAVEGLGEGDIKLGAERMQQLAERLSAGKKAA